jgi:hypothetical protein
MKLMIGDRKNSCNHHHCGDHHNSMPGRVHIIFPVESSPGEVQLDDAGVKPIYIYLKQITNKKKGMHIELYRI